MFFVEGFEMSSVNIQFIMTGNDIISCIVQGPKLM